MFWTQNKQSDNISFSSEKKVILHYFLTIHKSNIAGENHPQTETSDSVIKIIIWSPNVCWSRNFSWMQIVFWRNLLPCSRCLDGSSLIPLCEPYSSVPTWPLHHKPIHVNLTRSADGNRSTLPLTGTRDFAIMNTPVFLQLHCRANESGLWAHLNNENGTNYVQ